MTHDDTASESGLSYEARLLAGSIEPYFRWAAATTDDLLEAQAMLEPLCARLAAASPRRSAALGRFLTTDPRARPAAGDDDPRLAGAEAMAFHTALYELTGNTALSMLGEAVSHLVIENVLGGSATISAGVPPEEVRADHAQIAAAVVGGDGPEAERLMDSHLRSLHERWRRAMNEWAEATIDWL